jgi:hypothetical protein
MYIDVVLNFCNQKVMLKFCPIWFKLYHYLGTYFDAVFSILSAATICSKKPLSYQDSKFSKNTNINVMAPVCGLKLWAISMMYPRMLILRRCKGFYI